MITLILFLIIIYIDTIEVSYLYLKNHPIILLLLLLSWKEERKAREATNIQLRVCVNIGIKWYKTLCYDKAIVSFFVWI